MNQPDIEPGALGVVQKICAGLLMAGMTAVAFACLVWLIAHILASAPLG